MNGRVYRSGCAPTGMEVAVSRLCAHPTRRPSGAGTPAATGLAEKTSLAQEEGSGQVTAARPSAFVVVGQRTAYRPSAAHLGVNYYGRIDLLELMQTKAVFLSCRSSVPNWFTARTFGRFVKFGPFTL